MSQILCFCIQLMWEQIFNQFQKDRMKFEREGSIFMLEKGECIKQNLYFKICKADYEKLDCDCYITKRQGVGPGHILILSLK